MTLEQHPVMHYLAMLLFYHLGLVANMLTGAYISSQSKLNAFGSVKQYAVVRWIPLSIRWFACLCLFLTIWENPSVMNLERFTPTLPAHLGVAGGLGVVSDVIWDKFLAIVFPGVQKELPPVPPATTGG